ncbi:MAG TPA: alpha/beta fold hydrolase [Chloroflexota bacterium]|jgi:pimeloyl-ACP methyl ester carboxylesterase|nr:alpha/beta fold hydrolase [Chloroflexota bacterium]
MANRTEEIVWITTDDGVRHEGVVIQPTGPANGTAVVWMHGFTGYFCEPHQMTIGRYLAERGYQFVSGNGRGHHYGAGLGRWGGSPRLGGAWWELASEAFLDIKAWLDFAEKTLAPRRLVLAGHSYGGMKVVWYQGTQQDPRVAGLISASGGMRPPSRRPELAKETLELATKMVAEGRGLELLPFGMTGRPGTTLSAQTVVDRAKSLVDVYGLDGGADAPIGKVRCPFLAILGTNEPEIGSPADLETVKRNARSSPRVETALIEGADHVYTTTAEAVAQAIEGFLGRLG